ncbi:hypothetical protein BE08_23990 [Sorangium cellulosum]|uniref:Methyltransferase small domain-containing protein n=1 Tax=Sorangium cellulosum TaxID=56 RepID=A0A150PD63_SORCE|nr:hypothetical protein BE08_23990 [Sorangium cellulosum]
MDSLPDITRVAALPASTWRDLGARLREAGFTEDYLEGAWRGGMRAHEPSLQRPLLLWHVRRRRDRLGYAHRMFVLRDPVAWEGAIEVLGDVLLSELLDAGLLVQPEPRRVCSAFDLRIYRGLFVLCDDLSHRGDAVYGVGPGTAAFYAPGARPEPVASALDLGCGAGGAALWLARHAERVVATDINPRALAFVAINAALNLVDNIEVRAGDLFEAVAGESFDFIISQPPYVPRAPGVRAATYLFAGAQGHELVSRVALEAPRYLNKDGRVLLVFDHPIMKGDGRREAVIPFNPSMRAVVIRGAEVDADAYAIRHASPELRRGVEAFDAASTAMREHLESVGIRGLCPAICVMEHAARGEGYLDVVCAGTSLWNEVSARTLDRMMANRALLHRSGGEIPRGRVHIPDASIVVRSFAQDGRPSGKVYLGLPPDYLFPSLELDEAEWEALKALHGLPLPAEDVEVVVKAARVGLIDA